jgi:glutathione S-transferase
MWRFWKGRKTEKQNLERPEGLSIYGYPQCPFCRRVTNSAEALGLDIPLRNTLQDAPHREALAGAMGRATVPVLLIEGEDGDVTWLPESADIVRYLTERFPRSD